MLVLVMYVILDQRHVRTNGSFIIDATEVVLLDLKPHVLLKVQIGNERDLIEVTLNVELFAPQPFRYDIFFLNSIHKLICCVSLGNCIRVKIFLCCLSGYVIFEPQGCVLSTVRENSY